MDGGQLQSKITWTKRGRFFHRCTRFMKRLTPSDRRCRCAQYPPVWAPLESLWQAIRTVDNTSNRSEVYSKSVEIKSSKHHKNRGMPMRKPCLRKSHFHRLTCLTVVAQLLLTTGVTAEERPARGVVAADHPQAAAVGVRLLEMGGDAADAAVGTALALGVVHPFASGIGGGGFAISTRKTGETLALDFRETAPQKATEDMFLNQNGEVRAKASTEGALASHTGRTCGSLGTSSKIWQAAAADRCPTCCGTRTRRLFGLTNPRKKD